MPLEFGVFQGASVGPRPWDETEPRRLRNDVEVGIAADAAGFDTYWAPEHHCLEEYSHASSSHLACLAVGMQTKHIRRGDRHLQPLPGDQPSGARRRADRLHRRGHQRPRRARHRARQRLDRGQHVRRLHRRDRAPCGRRRSAPSRRCGRRTSSPWDGKYFSVPERCILPRVVQKPHPPLWVTASNPGTVETAAKMGIGAAMFNFADPEPAAAHWSTSTRAPSRRPSRSASFVNDKIMTIAPALCLEDGDEAREIFRRNIGMTGGSLQRLLRHHPALRRADEGHSASDPAVEAAPLIEELKGRRTCAAVRRRPVAGEPLPERHLRRLARRRHPHRRSASRTSASTSSCSSRSSAGTSRTRRRSSRSASSARRCCRTSVVAPRPDAAGRMAVVRGAAAHATELGPLGRPTTRRARSTTSRPTSAAARRGWYGRARRSRSPFPIRHGSGPQGRRRRINPLHLMTATGCDPASRVDLGMNTRYVDDMLVMMVQGGTQWDALCHVYYDDQLYNGFPATEVDSRGAQRGGFEQGARRVRLARRAARRGATRRASTACRRATRSPRADLEATEAPGHDASRRATSCWCARARCRR